SPAGTRNSGAPDTSIGPAGPHTSRRTVAGVRPGLRSTRRAPDPSAVLPPTSQCAAGGGAQAAAATPRRSPVPVDVTTDAATGGCSSWPGTVSVTAPGSSTVVGAPAGTGEDPSGPARAPSAAPVTSAPSVAADASGAVSNWGS